MAITCVPLVCMSWFIRKQIPILDYLGPIHQLDTEVSAILVEHGISVSQASQGFSEASLKEMPLDEPGRPWQPEEVIYLYNVSTVRVSKYPLDIERACEKKRFAIFDSIQVHALELRISS